MTATNKANSLYAFLDGTPETLKVTQQDGHIKGRLSHTNDKIETGGDKKLLTYIKANLKLHLRSRKASSIFFP